MSGAVILAGAGRSWRDRVLDLRDRLVTRPGFRALAARLPITRPVARARTRALFDLCAGFVYAQVLSAAVRLRLFDLLRDGPVATGVLAPRLGLTDARAERLLEAGEALALFARRGDGRWGLGALGAAMVDNPGIAAMVEHHALLYADLADPVALLRGEAGTTALAGYWAYGADAGAAAVAPYTALMAATQPLIAAEVLAAWPIGRHRRLLDVGGGEGAFLQAAAAAAPGLELGLFDLPAVAVRARTRLAGAGVRAAVQGGDLFADPWPTGADLLTLIRVVHDHDDDRALAILRAARAALAPGGTLLLAEPMSGTPGAEPAGAAYFGFYLLAMGRGRPRTPAALTALLQAAGFGRVRLRGTRTPLLVRVLAATA